MAKYEIELAKAKAKVDEFVRRMNHVLTEEKAIRKEIKQIRTLEREAASAKANEVNARVDRFVAEVEAISTECAELKEYLGAMDGEVSQVYVH